MVKLTQNIGCSEQIWMINIEYRVFVIEFEANVSQSYYIIRWGVYGNMDIHLHHFSNFWFPVGLFYLYDIHKDH